MLHSEEEPCPCDRAFFLRQFMKTLADFKRRIRPGVVMHGTFHRKFIGRENNECIWGDEDLGERGVSMVQSNSFALKTIRKSGESVVSWGSFRRASQRGIVDEETGTIMGEEDRAKELYPIETYNCRVTPCA